eukprot:11536243-Alexandrium_andersonii.AAC.1
MGARAVSIAKPLRNGHRLHLGSSGHDSSALTCVRAARRDWQTSPAQRWQPLMATSVPGP